MWKYVEITLFRVIPTITFIHFVTGKSSGILFDIFSGIRSGISSGILPGISSGRCSSISSQRCSGISSGISSRKCSGIFSGISSAICSGMSSGIPSGILSSIFSSILIPVWCTSPPGAKVFRQKTGRIPSNQGSCNQGLKRGTLHFGYFYDKSCPKEKNLGPNMPT